MLDRLTRLTVVVVLSLTACTPAAARYEPQVLARGELALGYDGRFSISAAGQPIARGPRWHGLAAHVACVEPARALAARAEADGDRALVFSVLGGILGGGSVAGLAGFAFSDPGMRYGLLAGGIATAALGTVFAALSHRFKNFANGQAIDALNIYNDELGAWGGDCQTPPPDLPPPPIEPDIPASLPSEEQASNRPIDKT